MRRLWRVLSAPGAESASQWVYQQVGHPSRTSLTISAIRVPEPIRFAGQEAAALIPVPWLPPGHVSFTLAASYGGVTTLSVLTHGGTFAPERLTALWEKAVADLATS